MSLKTCGPQQNITALLETAAATTDMSSSKTNITTTMPCAACKLLRRRCSPHCFFLPYFPSTQPEKFAAVHHVFGASNIRKMLQGVPVANREDAVTSMVYEARARLRDPIYGSVGLVASLQNQVSKLQEELSVALTEAATLRAQLSQSSTFVANTCQCHTSFESYYFEELLID